MKCEAETFYRSILRTLNSIHPGRQGPSQGD